MVSTTAAASSRTTSSRLGRLRPADALPISLSALCGSTRPAANAGAMPKSRPAAKRHGKGEEQDGRVDLDAWQSRQVCRADRLEHAQAAFGDQHAGHGAERSASSSAFDQQLAHEPAAARAERGTQAQFPPPLRAAREQQVGDVRARDQQHAAHDREQQHEGIPESAAQGLVEALDDDGALSRARAGSSLSCAARSA